MTTCLGGPSDDVVLRGTWNFLRRGGMVPPSPSQASQKSRKPPRRTFAPRAAGLAAINVKCPAAFAWRVGGVFDREKGQRRAAVLRTLLEPPRYLNGAARG